MRKWLLQSLPARLVESYDHAAGWGAVAEDELKELEDRLRFLDIFNKFRRWLGYCAIDAYRVSTGSITPLGGCKGLHADMASVSCRVFGQNHRQRKTSGDLEVT
jgi:hypothetical protein